MAKFLLVIYPMLNGPYLSVITRYIVLYKKEPNRIKISANIKWRVLDTMYTRCEEGLINIMSKYLRKIPCYEVCSMSALYFVIMSDSQTLDLYLSIY